MRGHFGAIVLIVVGSFFLLSNLGLLHISIGELFRTWWPLILIAVGLSLLVTPRSRK
jgi:cytochrome c biogenesis protein CcdA